MSHSLMVSLGNKEAKTRRFGLLLALLTVLYIIAVIAFIIVY